MFSEDASALTTLATALGAALHERDAYTRLHGDRDHDYVIRVMQEVSDHKHDPYLLGKFMDVIERSPLRVS